MNYFLAMFFACFRIINFNLKFQYIRTNHADIFVHIKKCDLIYFVTQINK